jgi:hypothetical protein
MRDDGHKVADNSFWLGAFLRRDHPLCNCYDLAAVIQVCCQALGNKPTPAGVGQGTPVSPKVSFIWPLRQDVLQRLTILV